MARKPLLATPPPAPDFARLSQEASRRLTAARRQKDDVGEDIREAYFFTMPRLSRQLRSDTPPSLQGGKDAAELVTGIGTEVNDDFATEIINGFFPPNANWCASKAAEGVPPQVWTQVQDAAKAADNAVFQALRASNFDAEMSTALVPDAGVGTVAIWVDQTGLHEPIRCQHIPIRELEINIGPYGDVDDRFAVRHVKYWTLPSVLPRIKLPAKFAKLITDKPEEWVRVTWGFWRDWSEPNDIVWKRVIMLDADVVDAGEERGDGCCPLVVMRFRPDALHAFGNGPTISSLPDLRVLDMLTEAQQNRAGTAMNPPFAFPDDGILNFEGGIKDGHAYPKRAMGGPTSQIEPLYFQGDVNFGLFTMDAVEKRVRRKHYADYPEQPGKTPPTATQWLDEMAKSQRRIGTPGQKFFHEGPAQIFARFRYLGLKRGSVPKLEIDGHAISTQASNPATKAQDQQDVQIALRLLEILQEFFPQLMAAVVDPMQTAENIRSKLGDEIVVYRSKEEAAQLIQQLLEAAPQVAGAMGGQDAGAAAPPAQGAPA